MSKVAFVYNVKCTDRPGDVPLLTVGSTSPHATTLLGWAMNAGGESSVSGLIWLCNRLGLENVQIFI
jgi:hypothetical protein